jgi:hypothetical protein
VAVRAEDGVAPAPTYLAPEVKVKLKAVPTPVTSGSVCWVTVSPESLEISGPTNNEVVEVVAHGSLGVERLLCALFKPGDDGPAVMAVHRFEPSAQVIVRVLPEGATAPVPLQWAWVYWRVQDTITPLRTDGDGRLHALPQGADQRSPWDYTTPFTSPVGTEVTLYFSRGAKPIPNTVLENYPDVFVARTVALDPAGLGGGAPGGAPTAAITLPDVVIRMTRPTELSVWPLLWELPTDAYHTSALNQGAALWTNPAGGGNLTQNDGGAALPPAAADRPRERGLKVEGQVDARATGIRLQVLDDSGNVVPLRQGIDPGAAVVQEVIPTLGPAAGAVKPFQSVLFFANAATVLGPVQILVRSAGILPPTMEAFAMLLCGFQIALVDDRLTNTNGQQRGPIQGEGHEMVAVDFQMSPQATTAALSAQTRARRVIGYQIVNTPRLLNGAAAAGPNNPIVLKPQMPLWMAELQIVGLNRARLENLMAHRYFLRNASVMIGPPALVSAQFSLDWSLLLAWDGPDMNSPAFVGTVARPNQTYQYRQEFTAVQAVELRFRDRGQIVDRVTGRDIAIGAQGEVPNAVVPAPTTIDFPVPGRRLPQLIVFGQNRPWGRHVGAAQQESVIIEFQPRVEVGGVEAIRGGDGVLLLRSVDVDGHPIDRGLVPDAGGVLAAPPPGDAVCRLPWVRVQGTNPAPPGDVDALINAIVAEYFNAHIAQPAVAMLPLVVWQQTAGLIFDHENGNDRQFFDQAAGRFRFSGISYGHARGMPLFGPPHGYGFGQLDLVFGRGANDDEVWSFVENIRTGVRLIMEEKANAARAMMAPHLPAALDRRTRAVFRREVVRRYNGGREFTWNGADWEISPGLNQWANNANHADGPNQRLLYPNGVLGTNIQYFVPFPAGNGAATVFPWPIFFTPADFGPGI